MSFKFGLALAAVATLAVAPMASAQTYNGGQLLGGAVGAVLGGVAGSQPVSYTHLTLPTILLV